MNPASTSRVQCRSPAAHPRLLRAHQGGGLGVCQQPRSCSQGTGPPPSDGLFSEHASGSEAHAGTSVLQPKGSSSCLTSGPHKMSSPGGQGPHMGRHLHAAQSIPYGSCGLGDAKGKSGPRCPGEKRPSRWADTAVCFSKMPCLLTRPRLRIRPLGSGEEPTALLPLIS